MKQNKNLYLDILIYRPVFHYKNSKVAKYLTEIVLDASQTTCQQPICVIIAEKLILHEFCVYSKVKYVV